MSEGRVEKKRAAQKKGLAAENRAATFLRLKGYSILARRFRTRQGEIDLVAQRGKTVVFVEVKSRLNAEQAASAIRLRQRRRIETAASVFLGRHPELSNLTCRFDAILVSPFALPRHIPDAWRPGESYG